MATIETIDTPPARPGLQRWLRKNLFSSWFNTLLTVLSVLIIFFTLRGLFTWIFFQANWQPVVQNLRLYAVGTYPIEQIWRVWIIIYIVSLLMGVSAGKWGGTVLTFGRVLGVAYLILALLPISFENLPISSRLLLSANLLFLVLGFIIGSRPFIKAGWVLSSWGISFAITIVILGGFKNSAALPPVSSGLWGGLLLTFLLAVVPIVIANIGSLIFIE